MLALEFPIQIATDTHTHEIVHIYSDYMQFHCDYDEHYRLNGHFPFVKVETNIRIYAIGHFQYFH